jgi:hypothetical protein
MRFVADLGRLEYEIEEQDVGTNSSRSNHNPEALALEAACTTTDSAARTPVTTPALWRFLTETIDHTTKLPLFRC